MKFFQSYDIPFYLTLFRLTFSPLVLAPLLVLAGTYHSVLLWGIAFLLFLVLCITDFADGYFARKYGTICQSGSVLDPIADKFLVISASVGLLAVQEIGWGWVLLFLCRDAFVTSLRLWGVQQRLELPVSFLAKLKTTIVFFALGLAILDKVATLVAIQHLFFLADAVFATLLIASILSIVTALMYVQRIYEGLTLSE